MEYEKNIVVDDKFKATLTVSLTKETVKKEYDALLTKYSKEKLPILNQMSVLNRFKWSIRN